MASGSKAWSIMSLGAALGSAAVAKKTLNTVLEVRHRQDPAGQPGRP
jgi:hypothetical protein